MLRNLMESRKIMRSPRAIPIKIKKGFKKQVKRSKHDKNKSNNHQEIFQFDHVSVSKDNVNFEYFQSWNPVSKYVDAQVFANVTSHSANKFFEQFVKNALFKVFSIQVDGGSEFSEKFYARNNLFPETVRAFKAEIRSAV